jgi:hypothetical protein
LSAVSLAGKIVQFVEFACKLVAKASDFSESATGQLTQHEEMDLVAQSITQLHENIVCLSVVSLDLDALSRRDKSLLPFREACLRVGNELISTLEHLKVSSPRKRWETIRKALESVMKENRLQTWRSA